MSRKVLIATVVIMVVTVGIAIHRHAKSGKPGQPDTQFDADNRPVAVVLAVARSGDVDDRITALGTVTARSSVIVKPRVDGLLQRVLFHEGQFVKANEVLEEIDPRPFQAQLDQNVGQLDRDKALLENAKLDVSRYQTLWDKNSVAKQQLDTEIALAHQYEGAVEADKGAVDNARLQLDFTQVKAPVSGRLGLRLVDAGNMVHAGDIGGLVVITQTQPIDLVFSVPSSYLASVMKGLRAGVHLQVEAWDQDNHGRLATGTLSTADNLIDVTTGTVKLKAEFANNDQVLYPNEFVNARLRLGIGHNAVLVPAAALQNGAEGPFVFVVGADHVAHMRTVVPGATVDNVVAINHGLEPGEQVVVDGLDQLRNGSAVTFSAAGKGVPTRSDDKSHQDRKANPSKSPA